MNRGQLWLLCCTASIWLKSCQSEMPAGPGWGAVAGEESFRRLDVEGALRLIRQDESLSWSDRCWCSSGLPSSRQFAQLKPCTKPNGRLTKTTMETMVLRWGCVLYTLTQFNHPFLQSEQRHFNLHSGLWMSSQSEYFLSGMSRLSCLFHRSKDDMFDFATTVTCRRSQPSYLPSWLLIQPQTLRKSSWGQFLSDWGPVGSQVEVRACEMSLSNPR